MRKKELEKFDGTPFVGTKTKIEKTEVINTQYGMALKVESYPITELNGKDLRASSILAFLKDDEGFFVGTDTKMDKFFKSKGVNVEELSEDLIVEGSSIPELLDKDVVVQMNRKTGYLELI